MRKTILSFSIRTVAKVQLLEMRRSVERALGVPLAEGDFHGNSVFTTELLGMRILLTGWRGLNGVETHQLHGIVEDIGFLDEETIRTDTPPHTIDIDVAIIDLLAVRQAGEWYIPSREELDAEAEYANQRDREFQTPEGGPHFDRDDDEG